MNKLLIATVALVTVFSMPALAVTVFAMPPAALTSPVPRFRAIPDVQKNTEANPEHRQGQPTEQRGQSSAYSNSPSNGSTSE